MKCPTCDFDNPEGMQFCGKCGERMTAVCPQCEFANPPDFAFCGKCGAKLGEPVDAPTPATPRLEDMHAQMQRFIPQPLVERMQTAADEAAGENRLITTLFADISGFTSLSNQHAAEEAVEIVNRCFKAIVDAVYRYEGSINRFIGDCVLAFFGAPLAHENDTERALLAALEMRDKVAELAQQAPQLGGWEAFWTGLQQKSQDDEAALETLRAAIEIWERAKVSKVASVDAAERTH